MKAAAVAETSTVCIRIKGYISMKLYNLTEVHYNSILVVIFEV